MIPTLLDGHGTPTESQQAQDGAKRGLQEGFKIIPSHLQCRWASFLKRVAGRVQLELPAKWGAPGPPKGGRLQGPTMGLVFGFRWADTALTVCPQTSQSLCTSTKASSVEA